ncbi:hypothetical protein IGI04_029250, partial [Brassica rapa subsp. trilocularis]
MRVHVNGRLPLIKKSMIEYDNGDEVVATLQYERLERHCSQCNKLDHEVRDCLEAKALKKALLVTQEVNHHKDDISSQVPRKEAGQLNRANVDNRVPLHRDEGIRQSYGGEVRHLTDRTLSYGVSQNQPLCRDRVLRGRDSHRQEWQPKHLKRPPGHMHNSRRYDIGGREDSRNYSDRFSGDSHAHHSSKSRHYHPYRRREEERRPSLRDRSPTPQELSSASRINLQPSVRGISLPMCNDKVPQEAVESALGEIREALSNYAACSDPTESAARRERLRLAELNGNIEKNAIQNAKILRARQAATEELLANGEKESSLRTPVSVRLGPLPADIAAREATNICSSTDTGSLERTHIKTRLGPVPVNLELSQDVGMVVSAERQSLEQTERVPAVERLGVLTTEGPKSSPIMRKRKLGRPPGSRKVMSSPALPQNAGSRKRKPQQDKPPTGRKKQNPEGEKSRRTVKQTKPRAINLRRAAKKMISDAWRDLGSGTVREKLVSTRSAISAWNRTQHRNSQ